MDEVSVCHGKLLLLILCDHFVHKSTPLWKQVSLLEVLYAESPRDGE